MPNKLGGQRSGQNNRQGSFRRLKRHRRLPGSALKTDRVQAMKESTTYQGIVEEGREEGREQGRIEEARKIILRQGKKKFGKANAAITAALEGTADLERLERLSDRLLTAASWQDLLDAE